MPKKKDAPQQSPTLYNSSLEKGLRVLKAFNQGLEYLSLAQIAEFAELDKSSAQRFVRTLVSLDYLCQEPETRRYRLSPLILHLGTAYIRNNPLVERAQPYMREFRRELNVTINFIELHDTNTIIIFRLLGSEVINTDVAPGTLFPWHVAAPGQAIVAFMDEDKVSELFKKSEFLAFGPDTLTTVKSLSKRLKQVREDGFAITHNESFEGDISIGVPIFGTRGEVLASLGAAVIDTRWSIEEVREKIAPRLVEVSRAISGGTNTSYYSHRRKN